MATVLERFTTSLQAKVGKCGRCGRTLTDPASVARGLGPVCWGKSHGDVFERDLDASDEEWERREKLLRSGGESDLGVNWQWIDPDSTAALQIPRTMRVSMRYRKDSGLFEAYGVVFWGFEQDREIIFASGQEIRTVWRAAINAGPQSEARVAAYQRGMRRRARA